MKYWMFLYTFSLLVHFSMQLPKYENCPSHIFLVGDSLKDCLVVRCSGNENNRRIVFKSCETVVCAEGKQVGFHHGNNLKNYPECCSYPICEN